MAVEIFLAFFFTLGTIAILALAFNHPGVARNAVKRIGGLAVKDSEDGDDREDQI